MNEYWEDMALIVEEVYGVHVDWEERFFICPECGEPIYECDWLGNDLESCPICNFEFEE